MRHIVGVVDWDNYYTMSLMEYVNQKNDLPFQIVTYSSWSQLVSQSNSVMRPPDLLMVGEHILQKDVSTPMMFITEDETKKEEKEYIYKYGNLLEVIDKITIFLDKNTTKDNTLIAVFSPIGRCGKTTLAYSLCRDMKSLYVGFEDYSIGSENERECSEFMYYLTSRNPKIVEVLDKLKHDKNCYVMKAPASYGDSRVVTSEHISWLKTIIVEKTDIRQVVFDIGFGAVNSLFSDDSQLLAFDRIIVPGLKEESSGKKLDSFRKLVEKASALIATKMEFVYMD